MLALRQARAARAILPRAVRIAIPQRRRPAAAVRFFSDDRPYASAVGEETLALTRNVLLPLNEKFIVGGAARFRGVGDAR